mgnify:CR=1 FL=1
MTDYKELKKEFDKLFLQIFPTNNSEVRMAFWQFIQEALQEREKQIIESKALTNHYYLARLFHNEYESRAKEHNWATNKDTQVEFNDLPYENRTLMLAVCKAVLWNIRSRLTPDNRKE